MIQVIVNGALGRMGSEVVRAIAQDAELEILAGVEKEPTESWLNLPQGRKVPLCGDLEALLERFSADVLVDFTLAEVTMSAVRVATARRLNLVIGTTGLTSEDLEEIDRLVKANDVGAVVAANFTLGAVILVHLAKIAAPFFDSAEIIELHHHGKIDAPSGTALATARAMIESRGRPFSLPRTEKQTLPGTRGGETEGVSIHSVRLPGLMANQEVMFGAPGQTLSLRHDTINRECYMPGILLAIKQVSNYKGLVYGLDRLLGL